MMSKKKKKKKRWNDLDQNEGRLVHMNGHHHHHHHHHLLPWCRFRSFYYFIVRLDWIHFFLFSSFDSSSLANRQRDVDECREIQKQIDTTTTIILKRFVHLKTRQRGWNEILEHISRFFRFSFIFFCWCCCCCCPSMISRKKCDKNILSNMIEEFWTRWGCLMVNEWLMSLSSIH